MSYLQDFQLLLETSQHAKFINLWEEYAQIDVVDGEELLLILEMVRKSSYAVQFGQIADSVLQLWQRTEDPTFKNSVLRLTLDLQTTNSTLFADLATKNLEERFGTHPHFNDFLRLVGLRTRHKFQGAISHFELLVHLQKGNFVFHERGWGVGEVMSLSLVREHVLVEFEGISSPKDLSFENAFKNLIPLSSEHFLARRFGNPDALEKEGKEEPLKLIHILLRDLGPKTATEIKDELCDLVIPENDWAKWWQQARSKLKKDTQVKSPDSSKERFELRKVALTHDTRFLDGLKSLKTADALISSTYQYSRDFPEVFKNPAIKDTIKELLEEAAKKNGNSEEKAAANELAVAFLMEDILDKKLKPEEENRFVSLSNPASVLEGIEIIAFKKRYLTLIREKKQEWQTVFLQLLFLVSQNMVRDYIFKELSADKATKVLLVERLRDLLSKASVYPEAFFWYFQNIMEDDVPLNDKQSKGQFLEAFFILLHAIESKEDYKDLVKKMYQFLTAKRYLAFREIIEGTSPVYLHEILLLASKCRTLSKQDQRILNSLAEVVQPSALRKEKREEDTLWTTAAGYKKVQERIQHIGTVETVDNAKEIEAARALGDLRENSEYKFALERRSRLQGELKTLSHELNKARILTKEDIQTDEVGVGSIIEVVDVKGEKTVYTLLGPWDADPERHILSFQSKLAQTMMGCKKGDSFDFQGEKFTVKSIKSYL